MGTGRGRVPELPLQARPRSPRPARAQVPPARTRTLGSVGCPCQGTLPVPPHCIPLSLSHSRNHVTCASLSFRSQQWQGGQALRPQVRVPPSSGGLGLRVGRTCVLGLLHAGLLVVHPAPESYAGVVPVLFLDLCRVSATACSLAADVLQALLVCSPGVAAGASVAQVSSWLTDALAHAEGGKLASQV